MVYWNDGHGVSYFTSIKHLVDIVMVMDASRNKQPC